MRVTRESLLRIAKETAQERAYNDTDIVAAYLTGSLLNVDPMLGGTADIDIVFVHKNKPMKSREFVKLTPDFHLDISRRTKDEFKSPRELRGDPWLGYEMYDPILLYEREKFFDFVQASLRAGFDFEQPPLMLQRCRKMLSHGRGIWMDLTEVDEAAVGPKEVKKYMKSLFHALNAVAELSGPPIQERRLLLEFPARAEAAGKPDMVAAAFGLLGANQVDLEKLQLWFSDWKSAYQTCQRKTRRGYSHPSRARELLRESHQSHAGRGCPLRRALAAFAHVDILRGSAGRRPFRILAEGSRRVGFARLGFRAEGGRTRPFPRRNRNHL